MSEINYGGPAFPHDAIEDPDTEGCFYGGHPGMTMRDYFAAKAMQAFIGQHVDACGDAHLAEESYAIADAMLKAREKGQP
jgi:hypothetical protein